MRCGGPLEHRACAGDKVVPRQELHDLGDFQRVRPIDSGERAFDSRSMARIANPTAVTTSGSSITGAFGAASLVTVRAGRSAGTRSSTVQPVSDPTTTDAASPCAVEPPFDDAEVQRVEPIGQIQAPTRHRDDHAEQLGGQVRRSRRGAVPARRRRRLRLQSRSHVTSRNVFVRCFSAGAIGTKISS